MPKHKRDIRFTDVGRWAAMGQIVDRRQEFAALPSYLAKLLAHSTRPTAYYNTNPFSTPLNPIERLRLESRGRFPLQSILRGVFEVTEQLATVLRTILERVFSKTNQGIREESRYGSATVRATLTSLSCEVRKPPLEPGKAP
jgi:hypothetical protein